MSTVRESKPLPFVFARRRSEAEPLHGTGGDPSEPKVWVVSVYPGDVHGMGRTLPEATQSAKMLVERALARADASGVGPFGWWMKAKAQMSDAQRDEFTETVALLLEKGEYEPFKLQVRMVAAPARKSGTRTSASRAKTMPPKRLQGLRFDLPSSAHGSMLKPCGSGT